MTVFAEEEEREETREKIRCGKTRTERSGRVQLVIPALTFAGGSESAAIGVFYHRGN
jgi:hypothetical protein